MVGVGGIYALLTDVSARPRYAFLLLQLVAENGGAIFDHGSGGIVLLRAA